MKKSSIGDRMKNNYEFSSKYQLPLRLPTIIRIDGKCFHNLTKNFKKPFDEGFINTMQKLAVELAREAMNTKLIYIQSDEMSFLLQGYEKEETENWFNGNIQKIASVIAGLASAKLSLMLGREASFDARVFVIPPMEVCNYFIWRQKDWLRNSIQMLGRANFSHKELYKLKNDEIQEKLWQEKNINWAKLPIHLKRGSCIKYTNKKWIIDKEIPEFTKDRDYIEKYIPDFFR